MNQAKTNNDSGWQTVSKRRHQPSPRETEPPLKKVAVRESFKKNTVKPVPSNVSLPTLPWYIRTPEDTKYALSALPDDVSHGLLHIFIRHYMQMESRIQGLRQLRWKLPASMQISVGSIMRASNIKAAQRHVDDLKKYLVSESDTLHAIQKLIWTYLQNVISTKTVTQFVKDGSTHMEYTLDSTNRKLVLIVSDRVEAPLRFDKRQIQRIITAYLSF